MDIVIINIVDLIKNMAIFIIFATLFWAHDVDYLQRKEKALALLYVQKHSFIIVIFQRTYYHLLHQDHHNVSPVQAINVKQDQ